MNLVRRGIFMEDDFVSVTKVVVSVNNEPVRNWVLGVMKKGYARFFNSSPVGKNKIAVSPKKGLKLFYSHQPGIGNLMIPIIKAEGQPENFGLTGYYPKTNESLEVSVVTVVKD